MEEENKLLKGLIKNQSELTELYSELGNKLRHTNKLIHDYGMKKSFKKGQISEVKKDVQNTN